jgi:glycerol-3-phosphate acyltransferase PlsX
VRVVVDAFGSDRAPGPEVAGSLRAVRAATAEARSAGRDPGERTLEVVLVGDAAHLESTLERLGRTPEDAITVVHASDVVAMDDHPAQAFRSKPDSSMRVAVAQVSEGKGDAVVSAGNSGAMLACALFVMGRLPGIERPAIVTVLATPAGPLVARRAVRRDRRGL